MVNKLSLILLTGMCFAQAKPVPKPAEPAAPVALPEVPVAYQNQFKSLIIRQKDIQLDEKDLQAKFAADQRVELQINADGQALSDKLLAELKLDPKKYSVQYQGDKMVVVEKK